MWTGTPVRLESSGPELGSGRVSTELPLSICFEYPRQLTASVEDLEILEAADMLAVEEDLRSTDIRCGG
jgi:hypothetical protein